MHQWSISAHECLGRLKSSFVVAAVLLSFAIPENVARDNLCSGQENSYLWKVHTSPPVYLFGTMHVPYTKLWNSIPENVKVAFSSSKEMGLELQLLDQNTVSALNSYRILPQGVSVDQFLSSDLIDRIESYLEKIKLLLPKWLDLEQGASVLFNGRPSIEEVFFSVVGDWRQMKPVWLLQLLDYLKEENVKSRQKPVIDTFLESAALGMDMKVEALEEPNDHCHPFNKLSRQQVELALRVQLDHLERQLDSNEESGGSMEDDIQIYRCGNFVRHIRHTPFLTFPPLENDTSSLTSMEMALLQRAEDYLWKQMVVKRNRKMSQRISALLKSQRNHTYFLGLGAGHFLSEKSVVYRLRKKGFSVEHIAADQVINGSSVPHNIIELGDPNSVARIMHIDSTAEISRDSNYRLHQSRLNALWEKYHGTTTSYPPSTSKLPNKTQTSSQSHSGQKDTKSKLSSEELQGETWKQEVQDLLQFKTPYEQSSPSLNSAARLLVPSSIGSCVILCLTTLIFFL